MRKYLSCNRLLYSLSLAVSLSIWIAQPVFAQVAQITGIKYKLTEKGLEIILVTPTPKNLLGFPKRQGNTRIYSISNTQLSLPCGNSFFKGNPVKGIKSISVTSNSNQVNVAVLGETSLPKVNVYISQSRIDCVKCGFEYSQDLRRNKIEGRANVVLDIDEQGNVTNARLGSSSGNAKLDNTVLQQVTGMKFMDNACGQKDVTLGATFFIQGSEFHQRVVKEYQIRRRQEYIKQQLRNTSE